MTNSDRKTGPGAIGRQFHIWKKGSDMIHDLWQDIRFAARTLVRRPGYAAAVLLTLVLAVGATTAVFSVVNGVLLHPLPHPKSDELVLVYEVDQRPGFFEDDNPVSAANFLDWNEQNSVFEEMAAFQTFSMTYRSGGDPEQISSGAVSDGFFRLLRAQTQLGRTFLAEEDVPGNDDVALLSHDFWRTRFNADSNIVGQTMTLGTTPVSIVGVLQEGFDFLDRQTSVWMPLGMTETRAQNRRSHNYNVIARMKPGITLESAQRDMDRVVDGLREVYPEFLTGWGVNVVSLNDRVVGDIRPALLVLLAAVGFVLLIASVNVANLMLARAAGEQREMAVRAALGAGGSRLIRQKLSESLIISILGGGLGTLAGVGVTRLLLAIAPENLPRVSEIGLDGRVLAFALLVSIATGLFIGFIPALQASRADVISGLKEGGTRSTGSRGLRRLRSGFVVTQLAFSLVLLISAGLMISTFSRLMAVDPGFEASGVATMKISIASSVYPTVADQTAIYDELLRAIAGMPTVETAGYTRLLPLADSEWTWSVQIIGKPEQQEGEKRDYGFHAISSDYFQTMGIAVTLGRSFDQFDRADGRGVVVINEALARRFFDEDENPIGRQMYVISLPDEILDIVGVVENVQHYALDREAEPAFFRPYHQITYDWFLGTMSLTVRTTGDPLAIVPTVRSIVRDVDPTIVISDVSTMTGRVDRSVARTRFAMTLLAAFAVVALALVVVGIYGVISYTVGQRSKEIGLRIALGANPARIVSQFMGSGFRLIVAGLGLGIVGALAFTRFQASLLFGVQAVDPITYAAVTGLLATVALLATFAPARRASKVDPMEVLREE
ncbi:MAG: ABC transporter permease [Gemmatimonadetes bacterium]|nr:ABC transporter permease [Gemmatimonadota bacterium]